MGGVCAYRLSENMKGEGLLGRLSSRWENIIETDLK